MAKKLCVLVVGHKKSAQGARNETTGETEFQFNTKLVKYVKAVAGEVNIKIVNRRTYKGLPAMINKLKPDFVLSFHDNAYNTKASGSETLYHEDKDDPTPWDGLSKQLARIVQDKMVGVLGLPDRGIKGRDEEGRGGYLLRNVKAPCGILEPVFIDNDEDLDNIKAKLKEFGDCIVEAIHDFAEVLG